MSVVLIKERHIVGAFQRASATSPDSARELAELHVHSSGLGWYRLRDRAVIRETSPGSGKFYLDAVVWEGLRRTRRRVIAGVVVIVLVGLLLGLGPWRL
ncbi:MAG: hypothetical protein ABI601_06095 [bacterium]